MVRFEKLARMRYCSERHGMTWHMGDENGRMIRCTCFKQWRLGSVLRSMAAPRSKRSKIARPKLTTWKLERMRDFLRRKP